MNYTEGGESQMSESSKSWVQRYAEALAELEALASMPLQAASAQSVDERSVASQLGLGNLGQQNGHTSLSASTELDRRFQQVSQRINKHLLPVLSAISYRAASACRPYEFVSAREFDFRVLLNNRNGKHYIVIPASVVPEHHALRQACRDSSSWFRTGNGGLVFVLGECICDRAGNAIPADFYPVQDVVKLTRRWVSDQKLEDEQKREAAEKVRHEQEQLQKQRDKQHKAVLKDAGLLE
jgi:hypothetical protein